MLPLHAHDKEYRPGWRLKERISGWIRYFFHQYVVKPVSLQADRTTARKPHCIHCVETPWTDHTAHRPCLM